MYLLLTGRSVDGAEWFWCDLKIKTCYCKFSPVPVLIKAGARKQPYSLSGARVGQERSCHCDSSSLHSPLPLAVPT